MRAGFQGCTGRETFQFVEKSKDIIGEGAVLKKSL